MDENYNLAKWLNGEMTETELSEFKKSSDYITYKKISDYTSQLKTTTFNENKMLENILKSTKSSPKVVRLFPKWIIQIAAVLVIGLGLFTAKNFISFTETAKNGENISFLLPDNSEVTLNSGSEIDYKKWNWNNERVLNLKGEAFFHVAKGEKFTVHTNLGDVSVLGTQFDVKTRNNRFEVECFEGKVWVKSGKENIILNKGQIIVLENNNLITALPTNSTKPSWTNNEIRITSLSLTNILSELEISYSIKITQLNITSDKKFTGYLPKNNLETALQIVCETYNLNVKKIDNNQIELIQK